MVFIAVSRAARAKIVLVLCLVALCALARTCAQLLSARLVAGTLKPVSRVETTQNLVALTFDLTYGESSPAEILDVLKASGVRCTFFIAGPWALAHPDIVKRMVNDGHEIGSQGYWHENLRTSGSDRIIESISRTHEILKGIAGKEPSLFRPPNGDYDDRVIRLALEVGYSTITWSLDSFDWRSTNEEYIAKRVTSRAKKGDVVRLHASDLSGQTARALRPIIDGLSQKGFSVVTVGELLKNSSE